MRNGKYLFAAIAAGALGIAGTAHAQDHMQHDMMNHETMDHGASNEMSPESDHSMPGALGAYPASRDASGTAWQPDSSPSQHGNMFEAGEWTAMAHGNVYGIHSNQGGPRGGEKTFSTSMAMLTASRAAGDVGRLQLRAMLSLDPLMGKSGYPLLFATGETADGRTTLVDRQHPHDLFMELSATYSHRLGEDRSVFFYAGLPGEPAFGPAAFMHRISAGESPEAPLTHHWLDSTHITFGVLTAGYIQGRMKVEASAFRGREPDERRYNIETPKLDSGSLRVTYNPDPDWSLQASVAQVKSPEQLHPDTDETRLSASATWNRPFGENNNWATTFAWGHKMLDPGDGLDGFLLESAVTLDARHTFFARAERIDAAELFDSTSPLHDATFIVNKLSAGYIRDFDLGGGATFGIGGLVSGYAYPDELDAFYGSSPTSSMVFMRLKLS